jgi:LAO/AO transport system kinase
MLHLKMTRDSDREIPVVKTVASQNKGIDELADFIMRHKEYLISKGKLAEKRKMNLIKQINELVNSRLEHHFWSGQRKNLLDKMIDKIAGREINPYDFVDELFG